MKKIVFVINAVSNQRCIKRVNEFVERGYNVVAHGDGFEEKMAQLACSALSEKPQQTVGNCFSWSNTACIEAGACRSILE